MRTFRLLSVETNIPGPLNAIFCYRADAIPPRHVDEGENHAVQKLPARHVDGYPPISHYTMDPVHAWPPFPNWIQFYCPVPPTIIFLPPTLEIGYREWQYYAGARVD
ncbi:hypothetical protein TNCV_611921 [Trichonephila clavipes]|nr:hypothetical protein TNCV_611921 [Trichonephila clavipes]